MPVRDQNSASVPDPLSVSDPAARVRRRREKAVAEILRNRRGQYQVPTWVLVAVLTMITTAWAAVIIVGSS